MFILVVEDNLKIRNADIYDDITGVRRALKIFTPERGYRIMIFMLDYEEQTYVEIYPEELDYEQE